MDKPIVYKWDKRDKIHQNPKDNQDNWKFLKPNSQGFLVDDFWWVFGISYGATNKHLLGRGPRKGY